MPLETLAEFVVFGSPVSQQTRRRQRVRDWIDLVAAAAHAEPAADQNLRKRPARVEITYYHGGGTPFDVDNIPKPVLDALKGVVLDDDAQVVDLVVRKRTLRWAERRSDLPERAVDALLAEDEFVHVTVLAYQNEDALE